MEQLTNQRSDPPLVPRVSDFFYLEQHLILILMFD